MLFAGRSSDSPLAVIVATVYDSIIMVSTKLLKHRLSLERLVEAKRENSRVSRAILSREAMIAAGGVSVVLALESVLAELIGLVRLY